MSKENKMGLNFELTLKTMCMEELISTKMYPAKHFLGLFLSNQLD